MPLSVVFALAEAPHGFRLRRFRTLESVRGRKEERRLRRAFEWLKDCAMNLCKAKLFKTDLSFVCHH
jgi:hypothetical protein